MYWSRSWCQPQAAICFPSSRNPSPNSLFIPNGNDYIITQVKWIQVQQYIFFFWHQNRWVKYIVFPNVPFKLCDFLFFFILSYCFFIVISQLFNYSMDLEKLINLFVIEMFIFCFFFLFEQLPIWFFLFFKFFFYQEAPFQTRHSEGNIKWLHVIIVHSFYTNRIQCLAVTCPLLQM